MYDLTNYVILLGISGTEQYVEWNLVSYTPVLRYISERTVQWLQTSAANVNNVQVIFLWQVVQNLRTALCVIKDSGHSHALSIHIQVSVGNVYFKLSTQSDETKKKDIWFWLVERRWRFIHVGWEINRVHYEFYRILWKTDEPSYFIPISSLMFVSTR